MVRDVTADKELDKEGVLFSVISLTKNLGNRGRK
jgi:hypothetical protein